VGGEEVGPAHQAHHRIPVYRVQAMLQAAGTRAGTTLFPCENKHRQRTSAVFDYIYRILLSFSVAYPGCLSWILDPNFFHPGFRSKKCPDPGSTSASKNLSNLNQKLFLSSRKYDSGCSFRIRILVPGVKKALDFECELKKVKKRFSLFSFKKNKF
jgi:hypothetical protein